MAGGINVQVLAVSHVEDNCNIQYSILYIQCSFGHSQLTSSFNLSKLSQQNWEKSQGRQKGNTCLHFLTRLSLTASYERFQSVCLYSLLSVCTTLPLSLSLCPSFFTLPSLLSPSLPLSHCCSLEWGQQLCGEPSWGSGTWAVEDRQLPAAALGLQIGKASARGLQA